MNLSSQDIASLETELRQAKEVITQMETELLAHKSTAAPTFKMPTAKPTTANATTAKLKPAAKPAPKPKAAPKQIDAAAVYAERASQTMRKKQ